MAESVNEQTQMSAAEPPLRSVPRLPESVRIDAKNPIPPHSPRELAIIEDGSGLTFQELVGEDARHSNRERVMVFLALRRLGFEPTWDDTLDVMVDYVAPDPPSAAPPTTSPPSATSGG